MRSRAKTQEQANQSGPSILLTDADPYLLFLIQNEIPGAQILEGWADPAPSQARPADLAVIRLEGADLAEKIERVKGIKVIAISDDDSADSGGEFVAVLKTPFAPAELSAAIRKALNIASPAEASGKGGLERLRRWLGPARIVGIVLAAILELTSGVHFGRLTILGLASAYAVTRLLWSRGGQAAAAADVAVATVLLAITGGLTSGYVLFGLVAAVGAGLEFPLRTGVMAGALVSMGSFVEVFYAVQRGNAPPRELAAWVASFPLAALTAGLAARISRGGGEADKTLIEANRLLSTLHRIARSMPGRLEVGGAAADALSTARSTIGAEAGLVVLGEAGIYAPIASHGLQGSHDVILGDDEFMASLLHGSVKVIKLQEMPSSLSTALGQHDCWLVAPLRHSGTLGLLFASCHDEAAHETNRLWLQQLADEAAVSIENAKLFRQVREMSVDEERQRLARELHDGVAQALTHIRLELEFLARHGVSSVAAAGEEAARLSRVVDRAASEVRIMINGLSSMVSREGLAVSLSSYLRDLRGLVTRKITFESNGIVRLPPDIEGEVFRITQEAVSNSLRHSKADSVHVQLDSTESGVMLLVQDDGIGVTNSKNGRGLGLKSMRERAERIGANLRVESGAEGGTKVILTFDHTRAPADQ